MAAKFVPDPEVLLGEGEAPPTKAEYDLYTDEAPAADVFGSPFYIFQDEPFWGQDRLDMLEEAIIRAKAAHGAFGHG